VTGVQTCALPISFDQMVSGFRCLMTWGYTRGYQPGKAVRHRLPASAVDPDERGHAPAGRLAAMGEEALGIGVRARPAAVDRGDSRAREALPRKRIEVGLPAAARVSHERVGRLEARGREGRADLVADLERPRPDRGTEPREDLRWRRAERPDGVLDDAGGQPPPAGVRD